MNLSKEEAREVIEHLTFKNGLVTAVVRDEENEDILMVAFMDEEAFVKTVTTGYMHYWSRSREEIWKKGEVSGNKQKVRRVKIDCDGDALLFDVEPEGPSCHKGYYSCFYRAVEDDGSLTKILEREFNPDDVYG